MKDFKAIFKTYFYKTKYNIGLKKEYGETFQKKELVFYEKMYEGKPLIHKVILDCIRTNKNIQTILEIGCGIGLFLTKNRDIFEGKKYTGIDISENATDIARERSTGEFICGDFLDDGFEKKFDLIFSESVIDHVYDIDKFITKCVKLTKKYAIITSFRGYFPELEEHQTEFRNDEGIYYNNISVKKVKKILIDLGLNQKEFSIEFKRKREELDKGHTIIFQ